MPIDMPSEWIEDYELNIECIDLQHRYFFRLLFKIAHDLHTTPHSRPLDELISELNAYARFHFISEENFMAEHGFPELTSHKFQHLELLDQLSTKQSALSLDKTGKKAQEFIEFLFEWFVRHTTKVDRVFADHYHAKQSEKNKK